MSPLRALVVDDHEPFRRFIRSMLEGASLRVVGEASDGLQAVQRAAALQPDLILLDVALPKLNGINAVVQMRTAAPRAKILFLSLEASIDVVQRALELGAYGYLQKPRIHRDLLPAIDSVLRGKQYVSIEVRAICKRPEVPRCHEVEFYADDERFLTSASGFVASALNTNNPAIVVATSSHRQGLTKRLNKEGCDIKGAIRRGTYVSLDAARLLSEVMMGDLLDSVSFFQGFSTRITSALKAAGTNNPRVAICAECVGLLSTRGNTTAAIQAERVGTELLKTYNIEILCAYPQKAFREGETKRAFEAICNEHSGVRLR